MGRSVFVVVVASLLLLPAGVSLASAAAAEGLPDGSPSGEARDPRYDRISLIHGSFDPLVAGLPVAAGFSAPAATDSRYVFVQLTGPVRPEWRAAVESIGRIIEYVPHNAFLMKFDDPVVSQPTLFSMPFVRATVPFLPQYKVQPGLAAVSGSTPLLIDVFPWESYLPLVASIVSNGGKVERQYQSEWHTTVSAQVDARIIPLLASLEGVRWIQRWTEPTIANKDGQWVVQSGIQDNRPIWNRSIRGEGQVVAYADTGMDWDHSFFRDPADKPPGPGARKTIGYVRWANQFGDNMGHGTHVAGTIAGNDVPVNGTSANIGNAPAAFLWVDDVSNTGGDWEAPQDLNPLYEKSFNGSSNSSTGEGARLHSNSWGWPSEHNYTMVAATTDEFMWNHQDYLVVIAAGNERGAGMNSLRSPGLAKNIVTVGATENGMTAQDMAGFSSTGPTQGDGRLKPTVCAPGVNIRSAMSDSDTTTKNSGETQMSGTSMATPTTAGALALLRQYFREGWYPSGTKTASDALTPSAPLMKATLMAGAVEISGAGTDSLNEGVFPNNSQGWGRVTLENSLFFDGDARKLWVKDDRTGVQTGANLTFKVKVNGVNEPLRVILAWSDAPGAVYSNPSIVNDLDLIVTSPGATYLGNRFAGKSPGHSVVGGMQDRVNVEEGVILPDATNGLVAGEYTINVVGQNVPTGPQPFALVVVGDIEGQAAVASVTIAPPTANVEVAKSAQFQARALDTAGNDVPGAKFTFTVTPPTLGTAADLGNGTAGFTAGTKTGTGVLTATASGKTANATITVTAGPIATLTVEPGTISMAVKGTAPARAVGKDQYGNDATPASVVWTVSVGLDATVTGSGASISLLAGTRSGTGEITADAVGKSAKATVNIAPGPPKKLEVPQSIDTVVGTNVSVSARVLDEYGNEIKSATATWATASGLGTFSPSTGLTVKFKAGTKAGNASFSVTSGALIEVRDLAVVPGPPAKITVIPDRVVLDPQGTKDLTAAVFDQYGNNISNASVKWEAPSFATVIPGEGYKVTIASEAIGGAQGVLYARVDAVQAQVPVTVNAFWAPDAISRGGLAATLFFLILLAIIGAIAAGAFVAMRRRHVKCARCEMKNNRGAERCFACGAPLGKGAAAGGPGMPPGSGPGPGGPPPVDPNAVPPPPEDYQSGPPPGGPGYGGGPDYGGGPGYGQGPPQQYGDPYAQGQQPYGPPQQWSNQEPMAPSPGRRPNDGWR